MGDILQTAFKIDSLCHCADKELSYTLGSREYGDFLSGVHTRESTHFIYTKEDKIDEEQITKIYSKSYKPVSSIRNLQ